MKSLKDGNTCICPHCGAENDCSANAWINVMGDKTPPVCSHCNQPLDGKQTAGSPENGKSGERSFNILFFAIVFLLSALVIYLNHTFGVLTFRKDSGQIVYEIVLILFVSWVLASGKLRRNLKHLAIWAGIFLLLLAGYSYRHELSGIKEKVLTEVVPARGFQKNPNSVSYPLSSDGHFYIRARVNGIPVIFLADTGASHIVLSPEDARKLGIQTDKLRFDRLYETANGTVRGSSIRIADFKVGGIHLRNIGASVNEAGMRNSLLGMTFFKRLKRYEVKNDVLTLYWGG